MKYLFVLVAAGLLAAGQASAQNRAALAPHTAAAAQYKSIQLERAFSAFRTGSLHGGLLLLADVLALDPKDADAANLYRLNASRYAINIAEDCDVESPFAHCDTAIKYISSARKLGDSSVYHEVMAQALYQKIIHLEVEDFNKYRELMPPRMLMRDMAYRYLPEERKIFFRDLLKEAIEQVSVARGEVERQEKLVELTNKLKVIERHQRVVGTR
jgi:hypothetical protein